MGQPHFKSGKKAIVANIYREWKEKSKESIPVLMTKIDKALSITSNLIVAGDFNLDFNRLHDCTYQHQAEARLLCTAMSERGLSYSGFGNTFHRCVLGKTITSALDWVFASPSMISTDEWRKEAGASDHAIIGWSFGASLLKQPKTMTTRNLKRIDKAGFLQDLALKEWEKLAYVTVHEQARLLSAFLLESLDKFAPAKEVKLKRKQTPKPSKALKDLRRKRDNARKDPTKRDTFKSLRNKCVSLGRKEALIYNEKRISENHNNAWKIVKEMTGQTTNTTTVLKKDGHTLSEKEAALESNKFFLEKVEGIKSQIPPSTEDPLKGAKTKAERLGLVKKSFTLRCVSEAEVGEILRKLKNSSCPDLDGISPDMLKLAEPVIRTPLTFAVNSSIESGIVPSMWKRAKLIPLHKKGTKSTISNYRPVSILPSPSKILEEVIRRQLSKYCETNQIIPSCQHGFRSKRSTTTAVCAAHHDWKRAKQAGMEVGALFFDLSAAFDLIDVDILKSKLELYGADSKVTSWINSYLTGRKQQVLYGQTFSTEEDVKVGSPQGSILSPLLFLILTADMPEWVDDAVLTTYADDTTAYACGKTKAEVREKLEKAAANILAFMSATGLAANAEKTKFIMFSRSKETAPLTIGGAKITEGQKEPLLGFTISKDLKWSQHFSCLSLELKKRTGLLRRLRYHFPLSILIQMMNSFFTSRILYGLEVYTNPLVELSGSGTDSVIKQLQTLQNEAMRSILGLRRSNRVSQRELLLRTEQKSVLELSTAALARQTWNCLRGVRPDFLCERIEERIHVDRTTRAASKCDFPSQGVQDCLISNMTKMWNKFPENIRKCDKQSSAKRAIKLLAQCLCSN